jgi:glutaminase
MNYQKIIDDVYRVVNAVDEKGKVATYIPELAKVNPNYFGVCLTMLNDKQYGTGDCDVKFSIQSIAKVLSLSLAYKLLGEKIWKRVGVEPSGSTFNSLIQLEKNNGIPRNPFVNAGAMVICDLLISKLDNPKQDFLEFARDVSDNPKLKFSSLIVDSEKSTGYRNVALCNFMKSFGNIKNDPNIVLDFYFNLCAIEMSCKELSKTFLFLANEGRKVSDNKQILTLSKSKRINAIMQTCGFYDESGEFAFKVGLPGKSGVGGGIVAIHPGKYCIGVWSPKLNEKGNSYKGMQFLELFTTATGSSIF